MCAQKASKNLLPPEITYLPVKDIAPNPAQPRSVFDEDSLRSLADSIALYGVLNPLTVRIRLGQYELVAGERRLRACKLLGLREAPCLVLDVSTEQSGVLALIENLQRRDLGVIEEARGIDALTRAFGLSQEECARRLGRSQSYVANKLRLLRLPDEVLNALSAGELTERHGRALLRLPDDRAILSAAAEILKRGLNVSQSEAYIDSLLQPTAAAPKTRHRFILKDVRVFLNTVTHGVELMRSGGIDALVKQKETEDALVLTISIPKKAPAAAAVRAGNTKQT